jgi:hypothetical protein
MGNSSSLFLSLLAEKRVVILNDKASKFLAGAKSGAARNDTMTGALTVHSPMPRLLWFYRYR